MTMKEMIVHEALKLFSVNGFDAVSTRMIARAVGASDSVIYKHFTSKSEILSVIVEKCKERYKEKRMALDYKHICWDDVEAISMDMFNFQRNDEWVVMFRRLLIIEQFKNEEMAALYKEIFIDSAVDGMTWIFEKLIEQGYMKAGDPKVYAMELYAPFYMYHTFTREPDDLNEKLREHVNTFKRSVMTAKRKGNINC